MFSSLLAVAPMSAVFYFLMPSNHVLSFSHSGKVGAGSTHRRSHSSSVEVQLVCTRHCQSLALLERASSFRKCLTDLFAHTYVYEAFALVECTH